MLPTADGIPMPARLLRPEPAGRVRAFGVGATAALAGLLARLLVDGILGESTPFITFFPAIAIAAWIAGLGGGLVATVLSALLADVVLLASDGRTASDDAAALVFFVLSGAVLSAVGGQLQRALALAERARSRAVFLADASAVLSVRLERLATIEGLARVAVPAFADFCAIDLVDEGSRHVAARIVHADPAVVGRARQLRRTHPFDPSAPGGVAAILRTGRVEAALDRWPGARRAEDDPWVNGLLPVLPVRASIAAPIATPDGRRLGVITLLVSDPVRRFTDEDVETARDLGRRAGIAIDHAALFSAVNARSDELTAVIDAIADPVVIADPDGSIRSYNPAAEPILDAADEATFDAVLAALRPGPARRDVAQVGTSPRYVQPVVLEVQGEDGPSRVAILRDVTELLESEAARDAFLGMLSHELRTPITTIFGGSRMLLKPLDEEVRQSLTLDLAEETDRLYRLVEDLLVLSRFERGRLEIAPEPVLVQRVLSQVLAREGERLPGLRIASRVQSSLPPALADPTYIEQIVRNLIGNAAKYAGRTAAIEVRAWAADGQIHVELEDDGPGVPEADRERVFALYERLSERRDPMTPGAGIGLFVCRRLVEAMHGRISVRRGDRGGACFTFTLPAMAAGEGRDAA